MASTSCEIVVHAQPEVVWSVLWDVARYPEFMTDCVDATVTALAREDGQPSQRIEMHVQLIRPLVYSAVMVGAQPESISWEADATGGYLQNHSGSWRIESSTDGRTCTLYYQLQVAFELPIPDAVIRRFAELNLPTMLRQVKARAEKLARAQEI